MGMANLKTIQTIILFLLVSLDYIKSHVNDNPANVNHIPTRIEHQKKSIFFTKIKNIFKKPRKNDDNEKPIKNFRYYFNEISELAYLQYLNISHLPYKREIFDSNKTWPSLEVLILHDGRSLNTNDLMYISKIQNLNDLTISTYYIEIEAVNVLLSMVNLRVLKLNKISFSKSTDIKSTTNKSNLLELNLSDCNLLSGFINELSEFNQLKKIDLSNNDSLSAKDFSAISKMEQLEELNLCSCKLLNNVLINFSRLSQLKK